MECFALLARLSHSILNSIGHRGARLSCAVGSPRTMHAEAHSSQAAWFDGSYMQA